MKQQQTGRSRYLTFRFHVLILLQTVLLIHTISHKDAYYGDDWKMDKEKKTRELSENEEWLKIWTRKGRSNAALSEPLHHVTGFTEIDTSQYRTVVGTILRANRQYGLENFRKSASVLEFGCGGGAFLDALRFLAPDKQFSVSGVDYSPTLVETARHRVLGGTFWQQDARNVTGAFPDGEIFDIVTSFSVFQYFDRLEDVYRILSEMVRVVKKGGTIVVADVPDAEKRATAFSIKSNSSHYQSKSYNVAERTPEHLYIPKAFFLDNADKLGYRVESIHDESGLVPNLSFYSASQWRYTVFATKL